MAENENIQPEQTLLENNESTESAEKLQCTVNIEDAGAWKKKISLVVPRSEIDKEFNQQYGELMRTAEVPGFRKGRAPRRLVEKRFGEDVSNQTKLRLLTRVFEQMDEDQDFEVLGEPDFDPDKIELPDSGDLTFEYEVEVKPQFELPELENIEIEKPIFEITPERIDETLDQLRRRRGHQKDITDEPAQQDDIVTADVTMKVDGVDEPRETKDYPIPVAPAAVMGVMIEDMATVLAGAKIGDTKTCSAEVPDTHENEEFRQKKAEFTLKINHIRRLIPAELNEELFEALGVSDEAELRRQIENSLESQSDSEVRNLMSRQVYSYFDEKIDFELPAGVAARYADRALARSYYDLLNRGVPREDIDQRIDQLRAASGKQAAQQLKMSFIMERIADKLEIDVQDAEVNGFIARVAAYQRRRPEKLREEMARQGRLDELRQQIRDEKALDKILEMANVVDAPPTPKKEKKAPADKKTWAKTNKKDQKASQEQISTEKPSRKNVKRKPPSSDS